MAVWEKLFLNGSVFSPGALHLQLIQPSMDYEKKYPITQQPGEFIIARWERGYKYVELYYKDRLVGSVSGAGKLRSGVTIKDDFFHKIDLKLSEKPVMLDLVIDGYHSPVNRAHPLNELKAMGPIFWILGTMSFIAGALEVGGLSGFKILQTIFLLINMTIVGMYFLAAVMVGRKRPWAYWMAFGVFSLVFLFHILLMLVSWDFWSILLNIFRGAALGVLIYNLKTVISAGKHLKYGIPASDDLLDR